MIIPKCIVCSIIITLMVITTNSKQMGVYYVCQKFQSTQLIALLFSVISKVLSAALFSSSIFIYAGVFLHEVEGFLKLDWIRLK